MGSGYGTANDPGKTDMKMKTGEEALESDFTFITDIGDVDKSCQLEKLDKLFESDDDTSSSSGDDDDDQDEDAVGIFDFALPPVDGTLSKQRGLKCAESPEPIDFTAPVVFPHHKPCWVEKKGFKDPVLKNIHEFTCAICFLDITKGDGIILKMCLHSFCSECLISFIDLCHDPEPKCPASRPCYGIIFQTEIRAFAPSHVFHKFLDRTLLATVAKEKTFHCQTPDCPYLVIVEDNCSTGVDENFVCPICNESNCFKCKAIHKNLTCVEYHAKLKSQANNLATEKQIKGLIANNLAMLCPQCGALCEKVSGCDWMTCYLCKTQLCWATKGPRWGPGGNGDTSGGCRCRIDGKLCAPSCRNCH